MKQLREFTFGHQTCTVTMRRRSGLFDDLAGDLFFVADTNTAGFAPAGEQPFVLPAGEQSKSWGHLEALLGEMLRTELTRDSVVVGVGGGVISDIAAFAASIYMRGCDLVLVPTTLLSMVDAAFGGKTGVNLGGYKNMVGSFYPAGSLRLCPELLTTLPQREYISGLAEVFKTAMIGDVELFDLLEGNRDAVMRRDEDILRDLVWRCVMVKGEIVEADLRETGIRAHLNLGHTFGHALETEKGLGSWSHGEAVAWGIARAMETGVAAGLTDPAWARRVSSLLAAYGYRTDPLPEAADSMLAAMRKDKKRTSGGGRLILQRRAGETEVVDLDQTLVLRVLNGECAIGE